MRLRATALLTSIHTWINTNTSNFRFPLWLRSETRVLLSSKLSSQQLTLSARYVFTQHQKALVITAPSIYIVLLLSFSSPSHPLPYNTYYIALMHFHTLSGNTSESGIHCARFLIFLLFSPISLNCLCKHPQAQASLVLRIYCETQESFNLLPQPTLTEQFTSQSAPTSETITYTMCHVGHWHGVPDPLSSRILPWILLEF